MRALSYTGDRQVIVTDKPDPTPAASEVIVQIRATGICGSDLHMYRHPAATLIESGVTPGHEPCGVIVAVGPEVRGWAVGDRVVVYFRRTCGDCIWCQNGHRNLCLNRRSSYGHAPDAAGSHAEYMAVEAGSLLRLPEYLTFLDGAILACQGGTAYAPLTRLTVSGRDTLIVSGLGPVGLLATLFGVALGARVVGIDPSEGRRALAGQLGADATIDPTAGDPAEQVRELAPLGADALIETSGAPAAHGAIGELLRARGRAALVGLGTREFTMPLMRLVHREITLIGSSIYPTGQYEEMCALIHRKGIDLSRVVSERLTLEDGPRAFQLADSATTGKVCFQVGG
ncbi:MAG: alcohol dehydrogenase catalytic domain-containing protein [Chloroflexi bacterium]|nr:alcohol dehydrogenase catalytic domain-containing protein [Chloroflexota bacterium]